MSEKWTEDQLDAINTTDRAVIVSAAAGSGKTAVLIERTIRLLCDEKKCVPADRLLAVTFTNDAAAQMREKLWNAINEQIEIHPDNEWLQLQQSKLQMAKISTINSFCYDLVKNNIDSFDLTSGVRILDETESQSLIQNALDNVMESNYSDKPEMMKRLNDVFCNERDSELCNIIKQMYSFSRSLAFKDRWFNDAVNSYSKDSTFYKIWISTVFNNMCEKIKSALTSIDEAYKYACSLKYYSKIKPLIENDKVNIETLYSAVKTNSFLKLKSISDGFSFGRLYSKPDKGAPEDSDVEKAVVEYIKKIRDDYKDIIKDILDSCIYTDEEIESDLKLSKYVLESLLSLVNDMWTETWRMKTEKNAIDFSDVEILSIKLLAKETESGYERTQLAKDIVDGKLYDIIMIDEFQDVNNLQDIIFKLISSGDDTQIIGTNMFVVGDVKQSIYRFRQANPKIFLNTQKQAEQCKDSNTIKEIRLKKNFRSRKNVIDFVNFIFSSLMSSEIGEVVYNNDEALDFAAPYDDSNIPTEILTFNDEDETDEYRIVADKIRSMIDNKVTVTEKGIERPCRQSDFCILLRNRTHSRQYADALKVAGLSCQNEEMDGYLRSREISILINMLTVLDNPMNDIALASVLLSPVFCFTDGDILTVRMSRKEAKLYLAVLDIAEDKNDIKDDNLKIKCKQVVDTIRKLRFYSSGYNLEKLIRKIYVSTDFYSLASVFKDSDQKRANLRLLLEYANSYDKGIGGGLAGFIRYINTVFKNGGDFKQAGASGSSGNSVTIKTIHKSKGLEYPFVILASVSSKFTMMKKELSRKVLINQYRGIGFRFKNQQTLEKFSTVPYDSIQITNTKEMLSEELRLLYVALTRAKERIIITYPLKDVNIQKYSKLAKQIVKENKIMPYMTAGADSMQDWLTMALLLYSPDSKINNLYCYDVKMPYVKTDAVIIFAEPENNTVESITDESNNITAEPDKEMCKKLVHYLDYQYNDVYAETASKLTVTEVAKKESPLEFFYQIPKLADDKNRLSPTEKGTATHRFMEVADFDNAQNDLISEIHRLVEKGLITSKQAEGIDISSLKTFFSGEFYNRMKKSSHIMREKQFLVMISDLNLDNEMLKVYADTDGMLQGIADCLFEEEDGYVLVDYKTDNVNAVEELTEHYTMQLELYKAAFDLLLDKKIKSSYIYSFRLSKGIEINL